MHKVLLYVSGLYIELPIKEYVMSNNGVGPSWFPEGVRNGLTKFSLKYFTETAWKNHDENYTKGGTIKTKLQADKQFLNELKTDLSDKSFSKKVVGYPLAYSYYTAVSLFGWTAYNYIYM